MAIWFKRQCRMLSNCENFSETLSLQMDEMLDGMDFVDQAGKCSQPIKHQPITRTNLTPVNPKRLKAWEKSAHQIKLRPWCKKQRKGSR